MISWVHVVLAAGRSSRMGVPKARLNVLGAPQIDLFLSRGKRFGASHQIVVTGVHESRICFSTLERFGAVSVRNPDPESGQSDSMKRALEIIDRPEHVLMQPVDQVPLSLASYERMLDEPAGRIQIPTYRGSRGHPPLFPGWFLEEIRTLNGGQGIRSLYEEHADRIDEVELEDPAVCTDLDTPEELREARRRFDSQPDEYTGSF